MAVKRVNVKAGDSTSIRELRHEIAVMSHMHHPRLVRNTRRLLRTIGHHELPRLHQP